MKPLLLFFFLLLCGTAPAQRTLLLVKKGERTLLRYWQGGTIAFQLNNGAWQKGDFVALRHDSLFVMPRIVRYYFIGNDTLKLPVAGYPLNTIAAFPRRGMSVDFQHGDFGLTRSGTLVGKLLRIGGAGYAALGLINGLRDGNVSLKNNGTGLAIAGAVFAGGYALDKLQRYTYRLGGKYHLEVLQF